MMRKTPASCLSKQRGDKINYFTNSFLTSMFWKIYREVEPIEKTISRLNINVNEVLQEISLKLSLPKEKSLRINCCGKKRNTESNKEVYDFNIFLGDDEISCIIIYNDFDLSNLDVFLEIVFNRLLESKYTIMETINPANQLRITCTPK